MNSRAQGFTLVEMLIVTLLGAVIMGTIYQMIVMQDNTTRQQYAVVETQQNARTALAVITTDLKEISAVDGDVVDATATSLTIRALRKAGIACAKPNNSSFDVAVLGAPFTAGGTGISADSVLVFSDGANTASARDDSWLPLVVTGVASTTACATNPLGATSFQRITFGGSNPIANAGVGALLRSYVHTRYRLVDSGNYGQLMRTEGAGTETAIIDQLAKVADGGLAFRYFDAAGTAIADPNTAALRASIMTVQVKVRGKAPTQVSTTGNNTFQDSLVTTVYLRGNYRTQ